MAVAVAPSPAPLLRLTYEAYLAEDTVEGSYDIIDGVRVFMAAPTWIHQRKIGNVYNCFRTFERTRRTGRTLMAPFDILVQREPLRTRQPDVIFITNERVEELGGIPSDGPLPAGPDLIVEILSPSETPRSIGDKLADYSLVGTREAWVVSLNGETVQVLRLSPEGIHTVAVYAYGQTVVSAIISDLQVAVADIFDE